MRTRSLHAATLTLLLAAGVASLAATPAPPADPALFQSLRFRTVGPHRGGRVTAIAGQRAQPSTFYMGATGGGVWKTLDAGLSWTNVSDGAFATGSIGAIDVAESDPNVVFVGTGSAAIRSNVIQGRGVYRSGDGGRSWSFVGLRGAGQIGSLRVHPQDPDTVYVAALGQPFGPNAERGVFRTRDGGRSWQKVLFVDERTGAVSLALDASDPRVVYAGVWRAQRKPWTIISGGPASVCGLYKSTDGGDHWQHKTRGLPEDLIGKLDVDVSRADPKRVYVILEAPGTQAGLYRSDDAGESFEQVSSDPRLIARPFYYTYVDADPKDADVVWVDNLALWRSQDGGRSFRSVPTPHGDNHGLWINPDRPEIMIQANDGGANVTQDGGRSWTSQYNQPTAEIYQVEVDEQWPYRIYGAQQDNSTLIVPSRPPEASAPDLPVQLWRQGPGCETGPIKPKPGDPNVVYGACKGEFSRLDLRTGQEKLYWAHAQNRYGHAAREIAERFQRVAPFEISPHDPRVIYHGSQRVHRTQDEGVSWQAISPDLTANEPDKQGASGEPITRDITGEEVYSAIYAIRESTLEPGVIWVGANDGPIHLTRDGGAHWANVTPRGLPAGGRVQNLEPSPHRKGSAYVAIYRYLLDDWRPYVYATRDYGASWRLLTDASNGIPADVPTRVVREDPEREGLLYAGTEFGLYVSFDDGGRWQPLQLNLPVTPVTDLRVHRRDLVLSTMGRGFWVLDDLSPLHQLAAAQRAGAPYLYAPRTTVALRHPVLRQPAGPDPAPAGAIVDYVLPAGATDVRLELLDAAGRTVRAFTPGATGAGVDAAQGMRQPGRRAGSSELPAGAGHGRFVWDLRHEGVPGSSGRGSDGPFVAPGEYQVRLSVGSRTLTQPLRVKPDPRLAADGVTEADLREQEALNLRIREAIARARRLAARVDAERDRRRAAGEPSSADLDVLRARLVTAGGAYPQPMLIDQLQNLYRMTTGADQKLGREAFRRLDELAGRLAGEEQAAERLGAGAK
ncbi:MAG: hypothetical protein AB7O37_16415 [Vicinamibacteria bacterium]